MNVIRLVTSFFVVGSLSFSVQTQAAANQMTIYGTLAGYDQLTAKILLENGEVATVPKTSIEPAVEGMLVGKAKVSAQVDVKKLFELNPKIVAKFSQSRSKSK